MANPPAVNPESKSVRPGQQAQPALDTCLQGNSPAITHGNTPTVMPSGSQGRR